MEQDITLAEAQLALQQENNNPEAEVNTFEREFVQEPTPAVDTPAPEPAPDPAPDFFGNIPPRPAEAEPKPIFAEAVIEDMANKATQEAKDMPLDVKALEMQTITLLRAEEWVKSMLLQWYALDNKRDEYTYKKEDFDFLVQVLSPYVGEWNIPRWIPAATCYFAANLPLFQAAHANRKDNLRIRKLEAENEQLRKDKAVLQAVKNAEETNEGAERTRFNLDADGNYTYIGNEYVIDASRREKASLKDIAKILSLRTNTPAKIKKAFNLSDADFDNLKNGN